MSQLVREPLYQQLHQALREIITSGEFPAGEKFLTERQVSERFEISRVTANKALASLVSEGLLEFRRGVGTFVRARPLDLDLRVWMSFTERALASGRQPSTRVLRLESISAGQAPEEVGSLLKVGTEEVLCYMDRLRSVDGLPVILEKRHMVASFCPELTEDQLSGSIIALWAKHGLIVDRSEQSIRAVSIRGADASALDVREGSAGLLLTAVGYLAGNRPLWYERSLYRGDAYEFHNILGGSQPTAPARGRFLDTRTQ